MKLVIENQVDMIDYDNFKNSAKVDELPHAYSDV